MENKPKQIIIGLLVIIAVLAGFIIYNYFSVLPVMENTGYQKAISQILEQSFDCQKGVTLYKGNLNYTLINIVCLQEGIAG